MERATGLISSLFDLASSRALPFRHTKNHGYRMKVVNTDSVLQSTAFKMSLVITPESAAADIDALQTE